MQDESTGSHWLTEVQKYSKPVVSLVKAVGPFFLSQSKVACENYENFKLNKERLEALSVFLKEEAKKLAEERSKWRSIMFDSNGFTRVQAENNYHLITKELNKLSTIDKIKDFIGSDEEINPTEPISDAWVEQFNKLASSLNEEWRKDLLAKAFAKELKKPGSMSLVVLNCIGSFDEKTFRYFGALVNSSLRFYEINILPTTNFFTPKDYEINGEIVSRNLIEYSLAHLNLLDNSDKRSIIGKKNKPAHIRYGRRLLTITNTFGELPIAHINVRFFSPLGNDIAQLYEREINDNGNANFDQLCHEILTRHRNVYSASVSELNDADYAFFGN